jgi:hypothetical protein
MKYLKLFENFNNAIVDGKINSIYYNMINSYIKALLEYNTQNVDIIDSRLRKIFGTDFENLKFGINLIIKKSDNLNLDYITDFVMSVDILN